MSFQDLQDGSYSSVGRKPSQSSSQAVASSIFQINTAVAGFRRLVDAIGTAKDTPDHRQKLHDTRQRISQSVKETSAKLKSFCESDQGTNITATKKVEDAKFAKDFQTTLQEFQKVQQLFLERESTYSPSAPPSSLSVNSSSGEDLVTIQENQPFLPEQKSTEVPLLGNEIAFNEAIFEEREQGIREVQGQVGEVNEIFKDLAVLVDEQGVVIGDIQPHIEAASAGTNQAREELSKGSKSVKSRSSWCWWVMGIVVLVVIIIVIVLIV